MDWDPPGENELRSWRISAWARQRGLQFLTMGTHRVDLVRRQRFTQGGSGTSYSVANTKAGRAVEAASAGTLSLQATPRNIFGNGDLTVVLVGAPVANASSVQLLLYQVNGSNGVWLSTNGDESFNATSGRLSLNFLQSGVDRSAIYATSQFDGGLHAWVVRKKPSAHRIWRDGEQQTTTTVSSLAGAPTSASDTLNILGITTDGSYAAIDPVAMMAVFRGRGLSDSDCIRLSTIGREQVGLLLEPPRRVMWPVSAGGGTTVNVNTATETDTAQPIASSQRAALGLAAETDAAQAIALTQRAALGIAAETDTAQPLTSHQARALGLASETDTAQAISTGAVVSVGLASETDTAQALASNQAASVGLVSETDTAQSISVTGAGTLGTASETDTAQALVANQSATVGLASETDTAQPISRVEFITVGLASETDTAQPIVSLQRASISPALETDTAQEIGITGGEPPAPPAPTFQPGYKHNPRTARDLDPLPPIGDDLADLVRDKWDAIERANAAIKRARGGDAPAQATVPTPASAPAPRPSRRPAGAIAAAGLPLTDEQLRADEEAFILMVAEIL